MKTLAIILGVLCSFSIVLDATAADKGHHARLKALERVHSSERTAAQQLELAQHYYRGRKLEQSYQQLDLFLQRQPSHTEGWLLMGDIWKEWGQWQQALEAYSQAAALSPDRADIHLRRGQAFENLGKQEEADQAYAQYTALMKQ
ncbi:tetratricopeptide repeat protein [Microbulbifer sp. TYP-18]|uniref:tetratricopeptide repeat protein n=1 Tax=Microbulbifer sp. TYP-18 TaxID=3230024 RepID=UPI0034C5FE44